ncbi:ADP-ribosylation factor-like [Magallana gigas]|uniref:ADP-ribosylation factor-like n=1 Tax=Magallana gigas TaxID=29159 RepID=UPI0033426A24
MYSELIRQLKLRNKLLLGKTIFIIMGSLLTRLLTAFESCLKTEYKILILGLNAAGKTTILYQFKLNEKIQSIPTIGFNVETVSPMKGVSFTVWDVGGSGKVIPLWKHYYKNTHGLIYVVDSADRYRISESRGELFGILENDEMRGVPVVIIANQQDRPDALSTSALTDLLCLHKLTSRKWCIQPACAINGEGLHESINELVTLVKEFKKVSR